MKEAIANAGIFNLIIIFVIILLAFFVGSLSYTKAFKVKNTIIEEIERDQGYTQQTSERIDDWLSKVGYRMITDNTWNCPSTADIAKNNETVTLKTTSTDYQYCVYEIKHCVVSGNKNTKCGTYYRAIAYMYFDVPVVSQLLRIPVNGESVIYNEVKS